MIGYPTPSPYYVGTPREFGDYIKVGGQVLTKDGSASSPGYGFSAELGTGWYRIADGEGPHIRAAINPNQSLFDVGGLGIYLPLDGSSIRFGSSRDLSIFRDAADTLAQRRGTNAQSLKLYNTYTDASNYERLALTWSSNSIYLTVVAAGSGSSLRDMNLGRGNGDWRITGAAGHLIPVTDNTVDIGASGANRPRSIYVGTNVIVGGQVLGKDGTAGSPSYSFASQTDLGLFRESATNIRVVIGGVGKSQFGASNLDLNSGSRLGWNSTVDLSTGAIDLSLFRDAANILAQRNSVNAQTLNIYNTYTDGSNYERLGLRWVSNQAQLLTDEAGTGLNNRALLIGTGGTGSLIFQTGAATRWQINGASGHFISLNDNVYDIGASGATRPRSIYVGTAFKAPDGSVSVASLGFSSDGGLGFFRVGTNQLGITSGGVQIAEVNPFGGGPGGLYMVSTGIFGWGSGTGNLTAIDVKLARDAANVLALRNGVTGQTFRIYGTYTDASNFERAGFGWSSNVMYMFTENLGTGISRELHLRTGGASVLSLDTNNTNRWQVDGNGGHLFGFVDNTYDIGASGASRPRSIYVGTSVTVGGQVLIADGTAGAPSITFGADTDTGIYRFTSNLFGFSTGGTPRMVLGSGGPEIQAAGGYYWSATSDPSTPPDLGLLRDAANTLALRNGTAAQRLNLYNTYTDASNYERLSILWQSNDAIIATGQGGTGSARALKFGVNNLVQWSLNTSGHWVTETDNVFDIGASGATRPRNIHAGGYIRIGDATALVKSSVAMNNGAAAGAGTLTNAPVAGNPTKWIPIDDNGTTRYIPCW